MAMEEFSYRVDPDGRTWLRVPPGMSVAEAARLAGRAFAPAAECGEDGEGGEDATARRAIEHVANLMITVAELRVRLDHVERRLRQNGIS